MVFSYFGVWLPPKPSGALCSWSRKPPGEVEFEESEGGRGQLPRGVPTSVGGRGTICPLPAGVRLEQLEPVWESHGFPHSQTAPFTQSSIPGWGSGLKGVCWGKVTCSGQLKAPGQSRVLVSMRAREAEPGKPTLSAVEGSPCHFRDPDEQSLTLTHP